MNRITYTRRFLKSYKKKTKNNKELQKVYEGFLTKLIKNAYERSLQTHKVHTRFGLVYSSSVTGDIRVLWIWCNGSDEIVLLETGGHEGRGSVYR